MPAEGILGRIPDGIDSIADLMLQDSDINVYEGNNKIVFKEEAFTLGGIKQPTRKQIDEISIQERIKNARERYERHQKKKLEAFKKEDKFKSSFRNKCEFKLLNDMKYVPKKKAVKPIVDANKNVEGFGYVDSMERLNAILRKDKTNVSVELDDSLAVDR